MKKILLVLVLFAIITTGTVFADHPKGWGIGVVGSFGFGSVGGGGGGRPNMAQAGGKNPAGIPDALKAAGEILSEQIK